MTTSIEFEYKVSQLTRSDLEKLMDQLYSETGSSPTRYYGTKAEQVRAFTYWVKGHADRVQLVLRKVEHILSANANIPRTGPVENTKYLLWNQFVSLESYPLIEDAVTFGDKSPQTRDGYVAVYAIQNMNSWANWKSSSLSDYERRIAEQVGRLAGPLLGLNAGRRPDQPALFPVGMLR